MRNRFLLLCFVLLAALPASGRGLRFAVISDTHFGVPGAKQALEAVIADIPRAGKLDFVILLGDLTDKGSDGEFDLAAAALAELDKKCYVLTGNHDTKFTGTWETVYREKFGGARFLFEQSGYLIAGVPSGPYTLTGKEELREEDLEFLARAPGGKPVLLFIHHPLDQIKNVERLTALPVWVQVAAAFSGHLHTDKQTEYRGVPVFVCRSSLPDADRISGYNIVTIRRGKMIVSVRNPYAGSETVRWEGKLTKR